MRRKNDFVKSLIHWEEYYSFWFSRLYSMAISTIKWDGMKIYNPTLLELPEYFLVRRGGAVFFKDEIVGEYLVLPYTGLGRLNMYGEPSEIQAYGENGALYQGLFPGKNCVIIRNNPQCKNDLINIELFSKRLANSMITGDINLSAHRTPIMVSVPEERRFSVENVLNNFLSGAAKIFGNENLYDDDIKVLKLDAPYVVDKITENTLSIWNEWLNYLGVPSLIVQKKERQLADEVAQSMGGAIASRVPRLREREKAAGQIKELFGQDIKLAFAVDTTPVPDYNKREEYYEEFPKPYRSNGGDIRGE